MKIKILTKKNVLVYGAGEAGRQLCNSLKKNSELKIIGFIDDDKKLEKKILLGIKIYSPKELESLKLYKNVDLVVIALPSANRRRRNQIIKKLSKHKLTVKTLPSVSEIIDGRVTISDVKDVNIDDLLNRDQVKPDIKLLNKNIYKKIVLVTGAGGSIGSELCRQIIKLKPRKLLLLELNEYALYKIYEELILFSKKNKIFSLLADAQDQEKLEIIFESFKVDTVYHAAAYKHVPLVEENICSGVKNNVLSTLSVAEAAVSKKIKNLVLISSDKAVRSTNIMGASKRLAELCMQAIYSRSKNKNINFSIVRFGNVLESSGSVIPKFKKQILAGGPVTLTSKKVTRFFMTITEAAQLVIQAGAMGKKSEVFVLDMGKSIKIFDLIKQLINILGYSVKNKKNPKGEIEIKIIGLRPGEKLYEELLIGNKPKKTKHIKIKKINDPYIPYNKLKIELNNLIKLLKENKSFEVKKFLKRLLKSYKSNTKVIDSIYLAQKNK